MDVPLLCWVFDEVDGEIYIYVSNTSFSLLLYRSKDNIHMRVLVVTRTLAIALMTIGTLGQSGTVTAM